MWAGSLSLLLLLQGAITLVDSATVMSVGLGAEWMKIAVVTVSTMGIGAVLQGNSGANGLKCNILFGHPVHLRLINNLRQFCCSPEFRWRSR